MNKQTSIRVVFLILITVIPLALSYFLYVKSNEIDQTEQLQKEYATKIAMTATAQFELKNKFSTLEVEMKSTKVEFHTQETEQSLNIVLTNESLQTQEQKQIQGAKATDEALKARQTQLSLDTKATEEALVTQQAQQSLDATATMSLFQTQQADHILSANATINALQTQQSELEAQNGLLIEKNKVHVMQLINSAQPLPVNIQPEATPIILKNDETQFDYEKFGTKQTCDRVEQVVSTALDELTALETNSAYLWSGSIIQGKSLLTGILSPVTLSRAPMEISLLEQKVKIENPSKAAVEAKIKELLPSEENLPQARMVYNIEQVSSMEEVMVKAGLGAYILGNKSFGGKANFDFDFSEKQNHVMIQFYQIYYDVSFEPVNNPISVFFNPRSNLAEKNISIDNPPLYISNVSYGRMAIIIASSSSSAEVLKGAIQAKWMADIVSISTEIEAQKDSIVNNATYQMVFIGGTAGNASDLMTKRDFKYINDYINRETSYSKANPGLPIFYRANYLKDNQIARVGLSTKFVGLVNCEVEFLKRAKFAITLNKIYISTTGRVGPWRGVDLKYTFETNVNAPYQYNKLEAMLRDAESNESFNIQEPSKLILVPEINSSCLTISGNFERIVSGESPVSTPGSFNNHICFNDGYWINDSDGSKILEPTPITREVNVGVLILYITFTVNIIK